MYDVHNSIQFKPVGIGVFFKTDHEYQLFHVWWKQIVIDDKYGMCLAFFSYKDVNCRIEQNPQFLFIDVESFPMICITMTSNERWCFPNHRKQETPLFIWRFVQVQKGNNPRVHITEPFWLESTDDPWIPHIKSVKYGKPFNDTTSCIVFGL